MDLRHANPEAQAYIREQAIRLHQEGWTNVDIAKHFNVHKNTVGKWLKRARSEGVENAVKGQKRGVEKTCSHSCRMSRSNSC